MTIKKGLVVGMHYTLKNDNGDVLDSSKGQSPLAFIVGTGTIIQGLEKELEGKKVGDAFVATVAPEDAYGVRSEENVVQVPITQFDQPENVKVGARFQVGGQGGTVAEVIQVENEQVTIDTNHPLADQMLHFDVEIIELREPTKEELEHGHVHGPNGTCSDQ